MQDPFAPPPPAASYPVTPPGYAAPPLSPTHQPAAAYPPAVAYPPPGPAFSPAPVTGPAGYPPAPRATNSSATIAFVLSLLGLVFTPIVDIAAVIVGHHALRTIRRTGEAGAGLAKAALAIGYGLIGVGALVTAFIVAMLVGSTAQ